MIHPFAIFKPIGSIPIDVVLVTVPFAKWQVAANDDEMFFKPQKS